jgi:release factor glutamine methyltransferase
VRPAQLVPRAAGYLERHGVESPVVTAELLLADALDTSRSDLYRRERALTPAEARTFGRSLCTRCSGVPVQHITGEEGFRYLVLRVRPGVFIPRPETEILVDAALEAIAKVPAPIVVDVGTGTGAVGLALVHERPGAEVWATDRSPAAVSLARENAERLGFRMHVEEGDLLAPLPEALAGRVDLVVSNPPYLEPEEHAALPPEVRADPYDALVGGTDVIERLAADAPRWLRPDGALAFEIAETQGDAARGVLRPLGYEDVVIRPDLAGRDRVVVARRPRPA